MKPIIVAAILAATTTAYLFLYLSRAVRAAGLPDGTSASFAIPMAAPHEVKLPDPWGQVGQDVSIRAVDVGGLECAVLVQRDGSERRSSLWCRTR